MKLNNTGKSFAPIGRGVLTFSRTAVPLFLVLLPLLPLKAAQESGIHPSHWWTVASTDAAERGKFSELVNRHRVYIETTFSDSRTIGTPSPTSQADVQHAVMQAVSAVRGLQIVANPSLAEFAIVVRGSAVTITGEREETGNFSLVLDPSTEVSVDIAVLVPGMPTPNGTRRPRVVWDAFSPNAKVEAQSAARFMVEGFLAEFKKLKDVPKH